MPGHRLVGLRDRRILGGYTVQSLAKAAIVTDETIRNLESPTHGSVRPAISQRILDALAPTVDIATSGIGNPGTVTTATEHRFQTGDVVTIAGHGGATPSINGARTVTRVDETTVTIPVNITDGGSGGTMTIDAAASVGFQALG